MPIVGIGQDDGDWPGLARLSQGQDFKQLVQGPESAGKDHQGIGSHGQVHLAHGEIVEAERQVRGRIGIGFLLVGQGDIEPDGRGPGLMGPAIGGLHDPRPAACSDDIVQDLTGPRQGPATFGDDPSQLTGHLIPVGLPPGPVWPHSGAAEDHDCGSDPVRLQGLLGLGIFQLEADPAHGVAEHEVRIQGRQAIGTGT